MARSNRPKSRRGEDAPPSDVTRELFLAWRAPRFGTSNPERLTNPVWSWLAHRKIDAYHANAHFEGPSSMSAGPCFCVSRYGQSVTKLADGRVISIAGEHEDSYDPDFYIYNDVIVKDATEHLEILGYPREIFPPTDFHSATLVGDRILMIGSLGYPAQRDPSVTPIYALDTTTMAISQVATTGALPGWIWKHEAALASDGGSIIVREGKRIVAAGGAHDIRDNIDDWSLDLESLVWTRLTDRRWPTFEIVRADSQANHLWPIESMYWHVDGKTPFDEEQLAKGRAQLGYDPDFEIYAARYSPPFAHEKVPEDEAAFNVTSIIIDSVTVRYVEESSSVRITVRGGLPEEKIRTLVEDARNKLETLERNSCVARRLES